MVKQQRLRSRLRQPSPPSSIPSDVEITPKQQANPTTKRKRDREEVSDSEEVPRTKSRKKKAVVKVASSRSKAPATKKAKQLYTTTISDVDKKIKALDKMVTPNGRSVTSDQYAQAMAKLLPKVVSLSNMAEDGVEYAFNLLLYLGEHSRGDFYACVKMCGFGDSEEPYKEMDQAMLELIERRQHHDANSTKADGVDTQENVVEVPHRWTDDDADVGVFKTGWPNKQQRNWIVRQRAEWTKDRSEKLRERREKTGDWVSNTLSELVEDSEYVAPYGLDGYFVGSIAKLKELKATAGVK
jgi:hypothetical protein